MKGLNSSALPLGQCLTLREYSTSGGPGGRDCFKEMERLRREAIDCLIFVGKDDTMADILTLLVQYNILLVAVCDQEANMCIANFIASFCHQMLMLVVMLDGFIFRFLGLVDVLNLVHFLVEHISHEVFKSTMASSVMEASGHNSWQPVHHRVPLSVLLRRLSLPDVNRVPVVDNNGIFLDEKRRRSRET